MTSAPGGGGLQPFVTKGVFLSEFKGLYKVSKIGSGVESRQKKPDVIYERPRVKCITKKSQQGRKALIAKAKEGEQQPTAKRHAVRQPLLTVSLRQAAPSRLATIRPQSSPQCQRRLMEPTRWCTLGQLLLRRPYNCRLRHLTFSLSPLPSI